MDVAHSCRCCLRCAPDKHLTTPYTHLGNTEIYSGMLKECFQIHLILDSDDDVGICEVCVGRLRDASDFKLQVQHSQMELQARLQQAPQVKEENPAVESIIDDGDGSSEEPVMCDNPQVKTETEYESETNDGGRQELLQDDPAVGVGTVNDAGTEDAILHEERAGDAEVSDDEEEDCISLARTGDGRADLEPARPVSARAREQLATACSVRLERLRGDQAPHASQTFKLKSSITNHVPKHASKKTLSHKIIRKDRKEICDVCNKQLANKESLKCHKRVHTGEKPFACGFCDKRFTQLSTLNAHTPQHTGERRYGCNVCNKRFTRLYTLRKHEKSHTGGDKYGERPFECDVCHMKFKLLYYLHAHKRTHLKVRPYGCDICDKRFIRNYDLSVHLEVHIGKKRFSCQLCNKQFSYRNDLKKHEVIHTRIKPTYTCDVCHERFLYKTALKSHTHTAEKRYTCDICKKQFKLKYVLIRHIRNHM